jgi:hypothetical protein
MATQRRGPCSVSCERGAMFGLVGLVRAEKRRQAAALHMVPREVRSGSFCDDTAGRQDGEKNCHDN